MEGIDEFDTIDVELDKYFNRKPIPRCRDAFLNILCDEIEEDDHLNEDDHPNQDAGEALEEDSDAGEEAQIRFRKCDSVRLVAECAGTPRKKPCPFFVKAFWMSNERSFQIKRLVDNHTCVRNYNNARLMDPTWLARQFVKELIRKPNLKSKEMQAIALSKYHCKVSWMKCYRARMRALSLINGKLSDHYAIVWEYRQELLRANPGSIIRISVVQNPDGTTLLKWRTRITGNGSLNLLHLTLEDENEGPVEGEDEGTGKGEDEGPGKGEGEGPVEGPTEGKVKDENAEKKLDDEVKAAFQLHCSYCYGSTKVTEDEFNEHQGDDGFESQEGVQIPVEPLLEVPETKVDEEGIDETQADEEGIDETQADEEGIDEPQADEGVGLEPEEGVGVRRLVRQRRPLERITLMKLKTRVVHKEGLGMSQDKPYSVE
ncbi:hypothetical protein LXL04_024203 [Taraxacum kok-saghyz]